MYRLMSAGPTQVAQDVLDARARPFPNPDEDESFVDCYAALCDDISRLVGNPQHQSFILGGEGILALEASIASLTQPGDRVLVLDNGVFGAGFADFVRLYGGLPVVYHAPYDAPLDPDELRSFLKDDHQFRYATLVHCDTPSGLRNDIHLLCPILKEYGILTVVDAVASLFGEAVDVNWGIDLLCGGSQKVLSAPPGLAFVTVSPLAWKTMQDRHTPVASFYANLLSFDQYRERKWFPYTMPVSDIMGFSAALRRVELDENILLRHETLAAACRQALVMGGLQLYPKSGHANTVTAFFLPEGVEASPLLLRMRQVEGILISGSFGPFAGTLLRIGHMGENCHRKNLEDCLLALARCFRYFDVTATHGLEDAVMQEFSALPSNL